MPGSERAIAEFFIMRKYRRRGIGCAVACQIFDRFPGKWEVQQMVSNQRAQFFWRRVIAHYTNGQYHEVTLHDERWHGPVQFFDNHP